LKGRSFSTASVILKGRSFSYAVTGSPFLVIPNRLQPVSDLLAFN
jgi:hypothetical protein